MKYLLPLLAVGGLWLSWAEPTEPLGASCLDNAGRSIEERIRTCPVPASGRANFKTREIAKLNHAAKFQNAQYGVEVEILSLTAIDGGVEVFAKAWKGGKPLGFGKDGSVEIERFRIFNPPVLVDDPNGDIVREWVDEDTGKTKRRLLREDPLGAIRNDLAHTVSLVGKEGSKIISGKVGNTTSTFYPSAGAAAPADGRFTYDNESTWAAVHDAAASETVTVVLAAGNAISAEKDGNYWVRRSAYGFDISAIGADTITGVTLSVAAEGYSVNPDSTTVDIVSFAPASNDTFVTGDYDQFGTTVYSDKLLSAWDKTAGNYNDFILGAPGIAYVANWLNLADDIGFLGARLGRDTDNSAPTGANTADARFVDQTGTDSDPKLVVEHAGASVAGWNDISIISE